MSTHVASRPRSKARAADREPSPRRWLRDLHLHGLDHLDAVLLAALASESTLLLIGPHGSAKSALLERVARALALEHRHYNASLISFDDLLGFPVPNASRDGLDYLRTPATLWGAQSVFLDEISRCRPEVQNKLFSIVHERRLAGVHLPGLRYRWAAMNPPAAFDADGEPDDVYLGSQPLDPALADRFAFVVSLPALGDLSPAERKLLIARGDAPVAGDAGLPGLIEAAGGHATDSEAADDAWVVDYIEAAAGLLAQARLPVSGRRAAMLRRAVHVVQGARVALGQCVAFGARTLEESALVALRWGLPQRAQAREPATSKLAAIHDKALELAGAPADSPARRLQATADPVQRIAIALSLPAGALSKTAFSALVADAFAAQDIAGRYLLARRLLVPLAERDAVNAPTLEMLGAPMARLVDFERDPLHKVQMTRAEVVRFNDLICALAGFDRTQAQQASLGNLLYTLFAVERATFDAREVIERDGRFASVLGQAQTFAPAGGVPAPCAADAPADHPERRS